MALALQGHVSPRGIATVQGFDALDSKPQQLGRDVETCLEIQCSQIRRPGAGRDPVTLRIFKSLGPGLRRDDEHFRTSASRVKTFPGQSWPRAGLLA